MGLITNEQRYIEAVKELFPRGSFFENELNNTESDLPNDTMSLVQIRTGGAKDLLKLTEIKGKEIYNFKKNIEALWKEARLETCTEVTIADYERTTTGTIRNDLSLSERKSILKQYEYGKLDLSMLQGIAKIYNARIIKAEYPYTPSTFGFSCFGKTRIINYKAFNVIHVYAILDESTIKEKFEEAITKVMLADKIIYFKYEENNTRSTVADDIPVAIGTQEAATV